MLTVEKETWRQGLLLSHGSSWMQANVYLINHGDQKIVIKDFSAAPYIVRGTFCRAILSSETRALQQLQQLHITPRYLGKIDGYAYAMEYIEGDNFKFAKHAKNIEFLIKMREAVKCMHEAGVVHNDLHGKNIIVTERGEFYFIDFASAFFRSDKTNMVGKLKNKLFDFLAMIDSAKVAVLINRYDPSFLTDDDNKILAIKKNVSRITRLWKKLINYPLIRKRTWQKRKEALQKWIHY